MMTGDDTEGSVWPEVAGAWGGFACSPGAVLGKFPDLPGQGGVKALVVARGVCSCRHTGGAPRTWRSRCCGDT
jgi:hypothetical protein